MIKRYIVSAAVLFLAVSSFRNLFPVSPENVFSDKSMLFSSSVSEQDNSHDKSGSRELFTSDLQDVQTVNPLGSFLRSAIVPGWGEMTNESKAGYFFLGVELILWGSRFYFQEQVNLYEKDAYMFALQNAALKPGDYEDEFMRKMSRYTSSGFGAGGYNEHVLRQAQNNYPDDPEKQNSYIMENAILDDDLAWDWGDRETRRSYGIKLKNADHNRDYVKFVTGAIVANHIISAINSTRIANRIRRSVNVELSFDLSEPALPRANLTYSF